MTQRILVVEDEPAILDLVAEVLVEEGFEVERAANGADFLSEVRQRVGRKLEIISPAEEARLALVSCQRSR